MSDELWTVTGPQTIEVDDVRSLKLGIVKGRFDVVTHDQPFVRIEVSEISGDPLTITLVNGRLEIRHQLQGPQGWFRNLMGTVNNTSTNSVIVGVALPPGVDVEAGTVSGDGLVAGISGRIRLNTVSGSVMADGTNGELHVNTVSGEVIARNHDGVLTAKSVSGEVTASGTFSNIRASTVSGDLTCELQDFTNDFGANSVSGDLTIRLPHDVGLDVVAKSASGSVVIDDRLYAQPGSNVHTIVGPDEKLMLLRTNTVSGKTYIMHAPAPAPETDSPVSGGTGL